VEKEWKAAPASSAHCYANLADLARERGDHNEEAAPDDFNTGTTLLLSPTQARMPVLLSLCFFARRDDFFMPLSQAD